MDLITRLSGADSRPAVAAVLAGRAELVEATEANYRAILFPQDAGGLKSAERLALAARMAALNGDAVLAAHYRSELGAHGEVPSALRRLADLADAEAGDTPRLAAMRRHVDLVTRTPRAATRADVDALLAAGIAEADVVRLAQLIAFLSYQVRVLAGLRLIGGAA
jgi:uncharacterized protein YciW